MSTSGTAGVEPTWTVNETTARIPASVSVFARYGIDSCCGGALSLAEAARRHDVSIDTLLAELATGAGARERIESRCADGSCGCGTR